VGLRGGSKGKGKERKREDKESIRERKGREGLPSNY